MSLLRARFPHKSNIAISYGASDNDVVVDDDIVVKKTNTKFVVHHIIHATILIIAILIVVIAGFSIGWLVGYWVSLPPPPPPTLLEMKQLRSCDVIFSLQRPLYSEDDWKYLRDLWASQQQEGEKQLKVIDREEENTNFTSPIKSGQTMDGKGRGLFATRDIKKGEMTYNGRWGYHNLIKFQNGQSYRKFVNSIVDDGMACDVMLWTYPLNNNLIFQADDNSLMNDGGKNLTNTGGNEVCQKGQHCGTYDEFATRDIKAGEEVLCKYSTFYPDYPGKEWDKFGL